MPSIKLNASMMPFVFLIVIFGSFAAMPYLPASIRENAVLVIIVGLFAFMGINYFYMIVTPRSYKHLKANIRVGNGVAAKDQHLYLGATQDNDLSVEQYDLSTTEYPAMVPGADAKQMELLKKPITTLAAKGYNWLFYMRFVVPVDFGTYKKRKSALVLSPLRFEESFKFMPRKKAAMWMESEIYSDHPSSDDCTLYLEDVPHNEYGEDIPVLVLKEGGGTWDKWRGGDDLFETEQYTKGYAAVIASNVVLQDKYVHSEQKVGVLKNQVEGMNKKVLDFSAAIKKQYKYTVEQTGSLEGAADWWLGENNMGAILVAVAIFGILALVAYTNPNFTKQLQAIWVSYWPIIVVIAIGGIVALYKFRNKIFGKKEA